MRARHADACAPSALIRKDQEAANPRQAEPFWLALANAYEACGIWV
jgi:hypothetical protein